MGGCCFTPFKNDQPPPQQPDQTQQDEHKNDELKNDELKNDELKNEGFVNWPFTHFFLSDLTAATNNFSDEEIISENAEESSDVVYKGFLSQNLGFVAVKRFKITPVDDPDFFEEDAETIGKLKHKRLVKLLGDCYEEGEVLLVAEYMPNDTLAKRLFHQKDLEWSMRLRVAYHIAEALEYCKTARYTFYANLSANTVLFDKDGDACLSSFGLLREIVCFNQRQRDREYWKTGNVTYRFGTILVNLLTGIQISPSDAPEMITGKDVTELIDPNLNGEYSKEEATVLLKLASDFLQCKNDRKNFITKEVVATLEALQAKTDIPSLALAKQKDVASSSQQQQAEPLQEVLSSEMPEIPKQQEEASSSSRQKQLAP